MTSKREAAKAARPLTVNCCMCAATVDVPAFGLVPRYCGNACRKRRYNSSPSGKDALKRYAQRPEVKESHKLRQQRPEVKATSKRYNSSPSGKEARKRHRQSPQGRATRARNRQRPEVKAREAAYTARTVEKLTDGYLASALRLPVAEAPPELIELKRQQLTLRRLAKTLKKAANETS